MKPISLTMKAFGSYIDETIDFTRLGDKNNDGLYLIMGDTGSGKTTIFDAICYAIYGEASGAGRDSGTIKSCFADDDALPWVSFKFQSRGKTYEVTRGKIRKAKKKGTGTLKTPSDDTRLVSTDGDFPPVTSHVTEYIQDNIIHLSYDQFKQVIMIAQGEFQKLIEADTGKKSAGDKSTTRQRILRIIFGTEFYERLDALLKSKMDDADREAADLSRRISDNFGEICCDGESPNADKLSEMKASAKIGLDSAKKLLDFIDEIKKEDDLLLNEYSERHNQQEKIARAAEKAKSDAAGQNKDIAKYLALKKEKEALEAKAEEHARDEETLDRCKRAASIAPTHDKMKTAADNAAKKARDIAEKEKEKAAAVQAESTATNEYDKVKGNDEEANKKLLAADKIADEKDNYTSHDALKAQENELTQKARALAEEIPKITTEIEDLKAVISKDEIDQSTLSDTINKRNEAESLAKIQCDAGKKARNILDEIKNYLDDKKISDNLEKKFDEEKRLYDELKERYDSEFNSYIADSAGIIAENLKEGDTCPVCGSKVHEAKLAKKKPSTVSKEALEKSKKARDDKENFIQNLSEETGKAKKLHEQERENIQKDISEINDILLSDETILPGARAKIPIAAPIDEIRAATQSIRNALASEYKKTIAKCDTLEREEKRLTALGSEIAKKKTDLEKMQNALKAKTSEESENKAELSRVTATLEKTKLAYPTWEKASEEMDKLRKEAQSMMNEIAAAKKAVDDAQKNLSSLSAVISSMKNDEKNLLEARDRATDEFNAALKRCNFKDEPDFISALPRDGETTINSLSDKIQKYELATETNMKLLKDIKERIGDKRAIIDIDALAETEKNEAERLKALKNKIDGLNLRMAKNEAGREKIAEDSPLYDESRKNYRIYKKLYYLVDGQKVDGQLNRDRLENFVLSRRLERILDSANDRLMKMTDNRYELCLKDESLNLNVIDHSNEKQRSVMTLSGGEKFLASLSLALGLSDTITERAGAVALDSLFIDEGFGTLDNEKLSKAIGVLQGLTKGHKLIGIISHREELASHIDSKVKVTIDEKGSHAKLDIA